MRIEDIYTGQVDKWLKEEYNEEVDRAKIIRIAILERLQLYALSIYLMQQMETKEITLDMKDFRASNKYILAMSPGGEGKKSVCKFSLQENPEPEPDWDEE